MDNAGLSQPSSNGTDLFASEDALDLYMERIEDPELFPQERKAIERYFTNGDARVLDLGCGVGRVASLLHERGYDVTGIDVSEQFVDRARSLFPEVSFRVADARDTGFDPNTFDYAVFSFFGLDYLLPRRERIRALREIHRVLKPAGILVFSSHNLWHSFVPTSLDDVRPTAGDLLDLYLREKNRDRIFSRQKIERVPLGEIEIYLSDPVHQRFQLRKCGFTPLEVLGEYEGIRRYFERDPHYVAKK